MYSPLNAKYSNDIYKTLNVYEKGAVGTKHMFLFMLHDCRMAGLVSPFHRPRRPLGRVEV